MDPLQGIELFIFRDKAHQDDGLAWRIKPIIPDELPCFDLTQISMRIKQFYKGLFESISLLFAWRAVCVEFISCSPLSN